VTVGTLGHTRSLTPVGGPSILSVMAWDEGIRRLSMAVAVIVSCGWMVYWAYLALVLGEDEPILLHLPIAIGAGAAAWGVVRLFAWVVRGFVPKSPD
jgi:hypothetical protein